VHEADALPITKAGVLPVSPTTGPIAYFVVSARDVFSERAYACQILLSEIILHRLRQTPDSRISIDGTGFDGSPIASHSVLFQELETADQDWEMVDRTGSRACSDLSTDDS